MNIIKRNAPVIVIGLITLVIFIGIIVISQKNSPLNGPSLTETTAENLITAHTYTLGKTDAPVTLVEFSDFECPACKAFQPVVRSLYDTYPEQLRIAYRNFPLPQHQFARKAAEAGELAGEQGKFWEYSDVLFANNTNLTETDLIKYAQDLGLNVDQFQTGLKNGDAAGFVNDDIAMAMKLNLPGTPSFFLNGKLVNYSTTQDLENQVISAINAVSGIQTPSSTNESTSSTSAVDQKYGTLEITYTDNGFTPKTSTGYVGQLVHITNTTSKVITFEQPIIKFPTIGAQRPMQPGSSFEFRIDSDKNWAFRETASGNFGSVFIYQPALGN
jgi:predicted DsbA family dithiol-disulfide isomerase